MHLNSRLVEPAAGQEPSPILLAKIGRMAVRRLGEALDPTGLKPRHIATMMVLRERAWSQSDLSEAVGIDSAKLVGVLNDLESGGLVTRKRDTCDRRRHTVELSPAGHARVETIGAAIASVEDALFEGLDAAQRAYLGALLAHIALNAADSCDEDHDPTP